ncbi:MAG: hypothetical protein BroJett014_04610 [Planctomycetota bacterium]|nr:MAG: hypothetical protein BroJett014_04610 [Planctomycetota bacterium]
MKLTSSRRRTAALVLFALLLLALLPLLSWGQAPTAPTSLFIHSADAQAGDASPATGIDLTPVFSATFNDADAGALGKKIKIQVSSDQTFAVVSHWNSGQITIADVANGARCQNVDYNGQALSGLTTYFWRCKFWDETDSAGDWSAAATFTTGPAPFAPTTLFVDDADASAQSSGNPVVEIDQNPVFTAIFTHQNAAAVANKAKIQVSTDSTFTTVSHWNSGQLIIANTAHNARTPNIAYNGQYLQGDTVYYWRIRLYDELGNVSPWSTEPASFRTILVPSAPTSLQVGSTEAQTGTSGNPVTNIDLTPVFSAVVNHPTAAMPATQVRIQVSTDSTFATVTHWKSGKINITPTLPSSRCPDVAYNGQPLSGQTIYYWRTRFFASDGGVSEWSTEAASFTTQAAPLSPTTLFIGSSEAQTGTQGDPVNLIDLNPTFSAVFQHQNTGVAGTKVRVQVSTDSTFADVTHWNSGQLTIPNVAHGARSSDVSYNGQLLHGNTRYFWRMRFYDANDNPGPWSTEAASFITILAPTEPTDLFVGSDNAQSGTSGNPVTGIDLTPVFSARMHHQDVAGIGKKIKVQVTTDPTFTNITHWNSAQLAIANVPDGARSQDVAYAGSPLSNSTTYYWRCRFHDAYPSTGPWSVEAASFTTIGAGTPEPATLSMPSLLQGGVYTNVTVSKSGGTAFASGNSFEFVSGGVSVSSVQVQDANTLIVSFSVDELSIAGNRTFEVRSGTEAIASGPAYVFHPSQRVPARRNGIAQEPLLNPALVSAGVVASTGEFLFEAQDLLLPGRMLPLGFGRNYRSLLEFDGTMGQSWASVVDDQLRYDLTGDSISYFSANGRLHTLTLAGSGTAGSGPYVETGSYVEWSRADQGDSDPLNDVYTALGAHGDKATYVASNLDTEGRRVYRLVSMADRFNNTVLLLRDAVGRVTEIRGDLYLATEPTRHRLLLDYGLDGRLRSIEDFADYTGEPADIVGSFTGSRTWNFVYDNKGRLAQVLLPKTKDWFEDEISSLSARARMLYEYTDAANPNLITDVHSPRQVALFQFDGSGRSWLKNTSDAQGRVAAQDVGRSSAADTTHRYHIVYGSGTCDVVDPVGRRVRVALTTGGRVQASAAFTGFFDNTLTQVAAKLRAADPDSFVTAYEYNTQGALVRMTMPRGNTKAWFFDEANSSQRAKGNLLRIAHLPGSADVQGLPQLPQGQQNGILTKFTYSTDFNFVTMRVDARAFDLQANYDITLAGQLARDDSAEFTITQTYDTLGRLVRIESPIVSEVVSPLSPNTGQQQITEFGYNVFGQMTERTDASPYSSGATGVARQFIYGASGFGRGHLIQSKVAPGTSAEMVEQYSYSAVGLVISVTDGAAATTTVHYNQFDLPVRSFGPALQGLGGIRYKAEMAFDRDGNAVQSTWFDPALDVNGNLSSDPERSGTTFWTRNIMGLTDAYTETVNSTHDRIGVLRYNAAFDLTEILSPGGTKIVNVRDERRLTYRIYRGLDAATTDLNTALAVETLSYDKNGNPTVFIDPRGNARTRLYDAYDRLALQRDARPAPTTVTVAYNASGQLISAETNGAAGDSNVSSSPITLLRKLEFQLDNLGRTYRKATWAVRQDGSTGLGYGADVTKTNDRPSWSTETTSFYPDGRIAAYFNDLLTGTNPAGSVPNSTVHYDLAGRRTSSADALGNETIWTYDVAGRVSTLTDRKFDQLSQTYLDIVQHFTRDELGRVVESWSQTGTAEEPHTVTVYNALSQGVVQFLPSRGRANRKVDLVGRITEASITANTRVLSGGSVVTPQSPATYKTTFQYNDDDLLVQLTDNSARITLRYYDLLRRHVQTRLPDSAVFTVGQTDAVQAISGKVGYVEATGGYDASGNVLYVNDLGQNVISRTYDAESNLVSVLVNPSQSNVLAGEHSASYVYDGLGRIKQCDSFDFQSNQTSRQQTWNSLNRLENATLTYNAMDDGSFACTVDELGRNFQITRGTTTVLHSFDVANRVVATRYKNTFGTTLFSDGVAFVGRLPFASGRTYTTTHDLEINRDGQARAVSVAEVPRFGSGPTLNRLSFEYCDCGGLEAVIDNDRKTTTTSVRGTRFLLDDFGRQYAQVSNATFPSTGSERADQYDTDEASATTVELYDSDDVVTQRIAYLGDKRNLTSPDSVVSIPHDDSLAPLAVGDIELERKLPTYTLPTADGVFEYTYDYQGRLINRRRISDGTILEKRRFDALGLERQRTYVETPVTDADFSTGDLSHVYFSSTSRDWSGGGVRFNSTSGDDFVEMYFPGELRPSNSFSPFQGAQVSYHDFLIGKEATATTRAKIAFQSWLDGYTFEFEVKASSIDLYENYTYYDTSLQQWVSTRNLLTSHSYSLPSTRECALGIRFDIGPTAALGNTVFVDLWVNGQHAIDSFSRTMDNTRAYKPQGVRFYTSANGARLYRYNSYVGVQPTSPLVQVLARQRSPKVNGPVPCNVSTPGEGSVSPYLGQLEQEIFGTSLLISQLQGFLHQLDFSEITGYADLVRRNQGRNLREGSIACKNNLLNAADRVVTDMIALRTAMDKFRDSQAIIGRLNQVSQEFSFFVLPEDVTDVPDGQGGFWPSIKGFVLPCPSPVGGWHLVGMAKRLQINGPPNPITEWAVEYYLVVVSDGAGILKSGAKFYVPSDWAPTSECNIVLTGEEERLMGSAYQDSRQRFRAEQQKRRADAEEALKRLRPEWIEVVGQFELMLGDISTLSMLFYHCNNVFEREGRWAQWDTAWSQALLNMLALYAAFKSLPPEVTNQFKRVPGLDFLDGDITNFLPGRTPPTVTPAPGTPPSPTLEAPTPNPAAKVVIGEGGSVDKGGILRGGGYDPKTNTLYISKVGHFDGMAQAGGTPNVRTTPGITTFEGPNVVYWANDSQSLGAAVTKEQAAAIQAGLEARFPGKTVVQVTDIGEAFK